MRKLIMALSAVSLAIPAVAIPTSADAKKRFDLFADFQKQVVTDLPALDLVAPDSFVIFDERVVNHTLGAEGFGYNGADIYLAS